jgi:transcriptional regulator with XRE-family HTH domain
VGTIRYEENDAQNAASLSRHFLDNENDVENDAFKCRLKQVIGEESVRSFALRAEISPSVVRQYLAGKSLPALDNLLAMTKAANVNLAWLATGEGLMRGERVESSRGCEAVDAEALTKALTLVEQVGPGLPLVRKVKVTAALYALFVKNERGLDADSLRQFVESLII